MVGWKPHKLHTSVFVFHGQCLEKLSFQQVKKSQFAGVLVIMSTVGICVLPAWADVTKTTGEWGRAACLTEMQAKHRLEVNDKTTINGRNDSFFLYIRILDCYSSMYFTYLCIILLYLFVFVIPRVSPMFFFWTKLIITSQITSYWRALNVLHITPRRFGPIVVRQ